VSISDTDGVSPSPPPVTGEPANRMRFVITVRNVGSSALTHTLLTTSLTDLPLGGEGVTTAALESSSSSKCTATAGGGARCDIGRLTAGQSLSVTFAYTTSHTSGVEGTRMDATVSVDEHVRDSDQPRDPNQEVRSTSNVTQYESRADFGLTFVPRAPTAVQVETSASSISFTSKGLESFFAEIQDYAKDPSHCFRGVTCLPQSTRGDLTATGDDFGAILWTRRISGVPKGISASSIQSVHFADPVPVAAHPATNSFSASKSFAASDGVRFMTDGSLPGGLSAGVDYFVVGATETTFQVSTKRRGKPVDLTSAGSGTLLAESIRVIGDDPGERWTSCTTSPPTLPAIVATQVTKTVIDTCVWTSENGWMK
jgi:hypothetical protein